MLVILLSLVACGDPSDSGDAVAGEAVFTANCAGCHGADGEGGSGPAMTDVIADADATDLVDTVLNGTGEMGPQSLTETEATDVVAYLVETWG